MNYYDANNVAQCREWLDDLRRALVDPLDETKDKFIAQSNMQQWRKELYLLADLCDELAGTIRGVLPPV